MSDFADAAVQRIADLAETILYEVEGVDENDRTVESARLLVAARIFKSNVEIFVIARKVDEEIKAK